MEILNGYLTYGVKDIPRSACVTVDSRHELPVIGNSDFVYMVIDENAVYRWDDNELLYFCVGRDYAEIDLINGGKAE